MRPVSLDQVIRRGMLVINGPLLPIMFGFPVLVFQVLQLLQLPAFLVLIAIPIGFSLAWGWWSWRVPRWRLWAMQQIADLATLHDRAVAAGIEWPYGHVFGRTEIKTRAHTLHELTYYLHYYLSQLHRVDSANDAVESPTRTTAEHAVLIARVRLQLEASIAQHGTPLTEINSLKQIAAEVRQHRGQGAAAGDELMETTLAFIERYCQLYEQEMVQRQIG